MSSADWDSGCDSDDDIANLNDVEELGPAGNSPPLSTSLSPASSRSLSPCSSPRRSQSPTWEPPADGSTMLSRRRRSTESVWLGSPPCRQFLLFAKVSSEQPLCSPGCEV